ncbi:DUF1868 domain-containing protein [Waterburya agarophytonicola K14]|uniref:DUF1868 domain-containing protein n=1 Tax=Waterburya agarophytonicola KI4 TaxID=2874699 RepID=A0A964FFD6_9CYAN|nr:DUF1868 domain-containing protein [Waterburya agarophytonicola]MCC0176801.1 DUF1868 domain-containing protein [Waterburya agarophytonicola KI4]
MDESYQDYINRVARLTLPTACSMQLQTIQHSPKFVEGKPVSFPGYSAITPPMEEDNLNQDFYRQVETIQQQLSQQLETDLFIPLPASSFHFTLADLIWDESYRQAIAANAEFDRVLQQEVAASFQQYQESLSDKKPLTWQLWGVMARPRAIMACLVPKDRESYESVIQLRRYLYQNSGLVGLGIEQQYDITAHITLGYFDKIPPSLNRDRLCIVLSQINDRLLESELPVFTVKEAQLRKFDNMVDYHRQPEWATVKFGV